ncbi:MAG: hypothetical protein WCB04_02170 [Mycobacteriales bacterium]
MPPPYAAYLRVYEPLTAFPKEEQGYWRQYLAKELALPRAQAVRMEYEHVLRRMLTGRLPDPGEHAFVTARGEMPMICPWRTALRAWEAVEDADLGGSGAVEAGLLPAADTQGRVLRPAGWGTSRPKGRSHIVTSTWAVPVRWFVLFGAEDKLLRIDDDERELVYVTDMSKARRRAARALASLRQGLGETLVTEAVEELARWLEDFHPRSLVELDYGGLVWLAEPSQLVLDESAADVAVALRSLAIQDGISASTAYERVTERWRPSQLMEGCN